MSTEEQNLSLEALYEVPVQISILLGKTSIQLSNLLKLGKGAVIELDRNVGDPVDVFVNNKMVAKGEIVVLENKIGVTLTELVTSDKEAK
ncbi:MAG: flagellar motor switch protein FliN [Alphaproteobacteria bacterium]|nr:flagellar motor switch protein FliN [Alphaproteobacteria bacterium]